MCTNFRPVAPKRLTDAFEVIPPDEDWVEEVYPSYAAPIIRLSQASAHSRECLAASFGLIPAWASDRHIGRHTYNARTETVGEKPSFRHAWHKRQFCLVPMQCFYEPGYHSGLAQRWRLQQRDGNSFAVAGIWDKWRRDGQDLLSFSLLTINADGHPLMGQFHRPNDEKRALVVVPPAQYDAWLQADSETARSFLSLMPLASFEAEAAPLQPQTLSLF